MKYTKKNRPKYFDKLPPDVQAARLLMKQENEINKMRVMPVHQHHNPTFREIQEDKLREAISN